MDLQTKVSLLVAFFSTATLIIASIGEIMYGRNK